MFFTICCYTSSEQPPPPRLVEANWKLANDLSIKCLSKSTHPIKQKPKNLMKGD
jgi:hypothetical protein